MGSRYVSWDGLESVVSANGILYYEPLRQRFIQEALHKLFLYVLQLTNLYRYG
jgi:hypothetical protein